MHTAILAQAITRSLPKHKNPPAHNQRPVTAMAVPMHSAETDSNPLYAPNDPCPQAWNTYLPTVFSDRVYTTLTRNRVPWLIIKQLADDGWTDVTSLAKRWGTEEQLYKHAADSLRITHLPQHHQEKIIATVAGAREDLKTLKDHHAQLSTRSQAAQLVDNLDRETMELAFQRVTQARLELKHQGSSNLLGKLHKAMAEGRIENLQFKDFVSFHPAPSSRNSTRQVQNPDGSYTEVEIQTRNMATTIDEWMDACRIFYHSLMMVATQHNEHPRLLPDWEPLRDFYEKFLFGTRVAKRRTPPSVSKLVYLERQAWQLIIEKLWEDKNTTLPEALQEVQKDSLWWTNELTTNSDYSTSRPPKGSGKSKGKYRNQHDGYNNNKGGKGRSKHQSKTRQVWQTNYQKGGKGKSKGGGKRNDMQQRSKGQDGNRSLPPPPQGGQPKVPRANWLTRPNGTPYCENYHVRGTCQEGRNCPREHTCPGCGQGFHPLMHCRNC